MCAGKISGIVDGRGAKKEEIGLLMTANESGEESEGGPEKIAAAPEKTKAEKIKEMFDVATKKFIVKAAVKKKKKEVKK